MTFEEWADRVISNGKQSGYITREGKKALRVASEEWLRGVLRQGWSGGAIERNEYFKAAANTWPTTK